MVAGWILAVIAFPVTLFFLIRGTVRHVRFIRYLQALKTYREKHDLS